MTILDVESGLKNLNGNESLYNRLLQRFMDSNLNAVADIENAIIANDSELSVRLAHTLKGVAASLGATALYECSLVIEAALKNGEPCQDKLPELQSILTQTFEQMQARL